MNRIIIDYIWISIGITVLLAVLAYFFPSLGNSGSAVTTVVGAMVTGQLYGQRTGSEVTSGFAWKVAAILTLAALLIAGVIVAVLSVAGIPVFPTEPAISGGAWVMIIGFSGLLIFLITRFAFRWGVKIGANAAASNKEN